MAVLRMDLDGQSAPEPRPPSNSSDSSEGDQRGPSPDSTFDLADEAGVEQQLNAGHPKCTFWLESQPVFLWLQAFGSDCFRMYDFKVKRCPRARPHDWTCCPFAHPGEKAKRRDPRRYRYSGTACPDFRKNGTCRRGDACPFAHGVFECWLHPSRYRTQICTDGTSCKRRVCFFAHTDAQLRKPEEDSVLLSQQLQAELAAEAQIHQQQQLVQTLTALLTTQGQNLLGGAPGLPNEVLQTLARQSLSGDLQAQAATSNATLQDRARLLQLQLQLNQIQQQQQQVLQGQKHQGGGAMPATALDALQDQVLHARDVIMQQQLQQQVDTELQAGAEDQAQRSLEALRLLKGVGGRGLSPNGRASVTSPFMAQQPVQGAGHLPLMPDMSRQLLGRERVCQAQEAPRRFSLDSQPMPHGQYHGAGSLAVPAPGYGPSRPVVDMEQLGYDLAALLQGRAVLNSGSSARSSLDGPAPQYGSGHHRGSFDGRPSQGVDAGFLGQPSHNQRRSVDLGALSRQFGGNPVGSKMLPMTPTHGGGGMGASGMVHRAGSGALQSIGEGRVASPHSLHRAVSGNLQSVAMPMHGQFVAGSSGHEVLTPEGQLRLQAMQQLLAQQAQRTQHQHGKPIGRYSADGGLTSSGHQTMSRAMMENVGMHSKAACPSPSSGASLIRNASFDRILLELPRSVSDVALGDQHLARATLVGNRSNE